MAAEAVVKQAAPVDRVVVAQAIVAQAVEPGPLAKDMQAAQVLLVLHTPVAVAVAPAAPVLIIAVQELE
jgi:hypothetical protein